MTAKAFCILFGIIFAVKFLYCIWMWVTTEDEIDDSHSWY